MGLMIIGAIIGAFSGGIPGILIGGVISFVSFLMAMFFVIQALALSREPEGYPSLIVTMGG